MPYSRDQIIGAFGGGMNGRRAYDALQLIHNAAATPMNELPDEQFQNAVFSDPGPAATLAAISGQPQQRGAIEMMGGGPKRKPRYPVSGGDPYWKRLKAAQAELEKRRANRTKVTQEQKDSTRDIVLANRARRREEMEGRRALRAQRLPRQVRYAMMRNAMNPSRFAPLSRNDIALMGLIQRAQADQADQRFGRDRLDQQQSQFEAEQRMALARMMLQQQQAAAQMQAQQQAQQEENQVRSQGDIMRANPEYAPLFLPPEIQQAQQQQQQVDMDKLAMLGLQGYDPQGRSPEQIIAALMADGRTREQIQAMLDRIPTGSGRTVEDPGGWSPGNFLGVPWPGAGPKSPYGTDMYGHPFKFLGELFGNQ